MREPAVVNVRMPAVSWGPSPNGGYVFRGAGAGAGFHAVFRSVPGRLVYTRHVGGVRTSVGWAALDDHADLARKLVGMIADLVEPC